MSLLLITIKSRWGELPLSRARHFPLAVGSPDQTQQLSDHSPHPNILDLLAPAHSQLHLKPSLWIKTAGRSKYQKPDLKA